MSNAPKIKERLELAEQLLSQAEHSSEIEMKLSLSRAYYAVYHLALVVLGSSARGHKQFKEPLNTLRDGLGEEFDRFRILRSKADYNPDFVRSEFGDLANFRREFTGLIVDVRELYDVFLTMVPSANDN